MKCTMTSTCVLIVPDLLIDMISGCTMFKCILNQVTLLISVTKNPAEKNTWEYIWTKVILLSLLSLILKRVTNVSSVQNHIIAKTIW